MDNFADFLMIVGGVVSLLTITSIFWIVLFKCIDKFY